MKELVSDFKGGYCTAKGGREGLTHAPVNRGARSSLYRIVLLLLGWMLDPTTGVTDDRTPLHVALITLLVITALLALFAAVPWLLTGR
jgi:hypothetical protein